MIGNRVCGHAGFMTPCLPHGLRCVARVSLLRRNALPPRLPRPKRQLPPVAADPVLRPRPRPRRRPRIVLVPPAPRPPVLVLASASHAILLSISSLSTTLTSNPFAFVLSPLPFRRHLEQPNDVHRFPPLAPHSIAEPRAIPCGIDFGQDSPRHASRCLRRCSRGSTWPPGEAGRPEGIGRAGESRQCDRSVDKTSSFSWLSMVVGSSAGGAGVRGGTAKRARTRTGRGTGTRRDEDGDEDEDEDEDGEEPLTAGRILGTAGGDGWGGFD